MKAQAAIEVGVIFSLILLLIGLVASSPVGAVALMARADRTQNARANLEAGKAMMRRKNEGVQAQFAERSNP